jgi:hypothetical protein
MIRARTRIRVVVLIGTVLVVAPLAVATEQTPKTFQQCGALLPPGKVYNFHMSGTIDMTNGTPLLHGELMVDDGTQIDRSHDQASAAFTKCISVLVK